ncbi:VIT1/CCC1 transporter family protein [Microcoleus sp.]|uniref:VIT1/CCC1 transporter family protein n=1 Tax=Microcoleus sp. TaxID=44472 RepID=UPI0035945AC1
MHEQLHNEHHFTSSEIVRDIVIGISDGLTVPFALAAGLSGAVDSTHIIIVAGIAEIAAGSIAMGLGGYLAAKSDEENYFKELGREQLEVAEKPKEEVMEVIAILQSYNLSLEESGPIAEALLKRPKAMVDFMMRFELGLEKPHPQRALKSASTIAGSYIAGGLIPLFPYMVFGNPEIGLLVSFIVTSIALAIFGYVKGRFTGTRPVRSAIQTVLIGGLAAIAAFLIARAISG